MNARQTETMGDKSWVFNPFHPPADLIRHDPSGLGNDEEFFRIEIR